MMKKLLCIHPLEDYEIIDSKMLKKFNIYPIFLYKTQLPAIHSEHGFLIQSFEYDAIYAVCKKLLPDYIVSFSESLFVDIANIRQILGIKGMDLSTAMLLSHKNLMYEKLYGHVPFPKTVKILPHTHFDSLKHELGADEIFIKPINKSGSFETYHIKNSADYNQFLLTYKENEDYLAQVYLSDDLYHAELAVFNGEIIFSSARKYSLPNHLMVSCDKPIFSINITDPKIYDTILTASLQVQEVFNFKNGILHTEFFLNHHGEVNFVETNARAPGIGLNRMYNKKLSISLETILCLIVCEVKPPKINEKNESYICGFYPIKPGKVKKINLPYLNIDNEWKVYVQPNDVLEKKEQMSKSAMVICWDACNKKVEATTMSLSNYPVVDMY